MMKMNRFLIVAVFTGAVGLWPAIAQAAPQVVTDPSGAVVLGEKLTLGMIADPSYAGQPCALVISKALTSGGTIKIESSSVLLNGSASAFGTCWRTVQVPRSLAAKATVYVQAFTLNPSTRQLEMSPVVTLAANAGTGKGRSYAVGMNLNFLRDYSTELVFVDGVAAMRDWIPYDLDNPYAWSTHACVVSEGHLANNLDPNGWPKQIPFSVICQCAGCPSYARVGVRTLLFREIQGNYPAGTYTLTYTGDGDIQTGFDAGSQTFTAGGSYPVTVTPSDSGVLLNLSRSNPANPIRDINFVMPGFQGSRRSQPFYPPFLAGLQPFRQGGTLRTMDFTETNNSPVQTWSQRTTLQHARQSGSTGVAWEHVIELANTRGMDPWINVPHQADDGYVRNLARLIRDQLDPGLKAYVEYSNEVWNPQFTQYGYAQQQGAQRGFNPYQFVTYRSAQMFDIFEQEFGATAAPRVVTVLAGQAGNSWVAQQELAALQNPAINPKGISVDAFAIAPYISGVTPQQLCDPSWAATVTPAQIAALVQADVPNAAQQIQAHKAVTDQYGVPLIAYEGGQHLVPRCNNTEVPILTQKFTQANLDPGMAAAYDALLQAWFQGGGGVFTHYSYVSQPGGYGMWGALEDLMRPVATFPKYGKLLEWATK